MTESNRCAIYARISTDKQSTLSPVDQIRKCREYADNHGFVVIPEHVYTDEGVSGVGSDRPAFRNLLTAASSSARPFNIILADDTSRFSRSLAQAVGVMEQLKFDGLRVIFVSQGIDSDSEQSDVQLTVHGLVDSLYVKELAKKTHRGLEGRILRGLHAGGRCYGYRAILANVEKSKLLTIHDSEAHVIRRIFEMSAGGASLKTIAKTLNAESVPSPRSRSGRRSTWCPTAVREMLKRPLYKGELIWNRSKFTKAPGTNKRRRKLRPSNEWKRQQRPELAIVSTELWDKVQLRFQSFDGKPSGGKTTGLFPRSLTSPYLFSGLLKCGHCASNLSILTGGGTHRHPKYVCTGYFNRGVCQNSLYIRRDELEERLLANLQSDLLKPAVVDFAIAECGRQLRSALANFSDEVVQLRQRKAKLEREIGNFSEAIAEAGHSKYLLEEISAREREVGAIADRLLSAAPDSVESRIEGIRAFVTKEIADLRVLLNHDAMRAKTEIQRHVTEIRMLPANDRKGWHYIAEGSWNLLGSDSGVVQERQPFSWRFRMVAGVGFEPTTSGL
jgi:site-specific DNA recombinase